MSDGDDILSHKGVIIAIAVLAGVVTLGLGWLCTKALVGSLNSTLLKMRGGSPTRMRVGSPVGYLDPAPNMPGNGHYYPSVSQAGGRGTPYGAGPPTNYAVISASPPRGAEPQVVHVSPPHGAGLTSFTSFEEPNPERTEASGITVITEDGGEEEEEEDSVAKLQAKQDRIRAAQAARREAEENLAADLLAEAAKSENDEILRRQASQRETEQRRAAELQAASVASEKQKIANEERLSNQARETRLQEQRIADQRAAAAARVVERKAEVARARAAREAEETRARRAEEAWERAAPSMPGMGQNAASRAADRALNNKEPAGQANHEMDMVAKLQARQDRIHDAQAAQRKADQKVEADLLDGPAAIDRDSRPLLAHFRPRHSLGLVPQARNDNPRLKNAKLAKLHEQSQPTTFEVVKFKRPKQREGAIPNLRQMTTGPTH